MDLEEYKENDLVLNTIYDLKLFFQEINNYTYHRSPKQKDLKYVLKK